MNSSTTFRLSNVVTLSPDVVWFEKDSWDLLSSGQQENLPLCPAFAIELRSGTDALSRE